MTFLSELRSWNPIVWGKSVSAIPTVGQKASSAGQLQFPRSDKKPTVIAFLRHCGCPFAEKTFHLLRDAAKANPDVHFIAISHSDNVATENWLQAVGGVGQVEVIVDYNRDIYAAYGLGLSSFWHVLNGGSLGSVGKLKESEQIDVRSTESGSRWQTAGVFSINAQGNIAHSHPAKSAEDLGDIDNAISAAKK